jgi:hypothetical protein
MTLYNPVLREKIGIEFEYKSSFISYLFQVLDEDVILDYVTMANNPGSRQVAVERVELTGPSMGFEYRAGVYNALKMLNDALLASDWVQEGDKDDIETLVSLVGRYVGLEGEHSYHFTVATFKVAEAISAAIDNAVEPTPPPSPPAP